MEGSEEQLARETSREHPATSQLTHKRKAVKWQHEGSMNPMKFYTYDLTRKPPTCTQKAGRN